MQSTLTDQQKRIITKLADYTRSQATVQLVQDTTIMFLVGVSGAGKNLLGERLMATGDYSPIISHTTRQPRLNQGVMEQDGVDYHFISLEDAERMIDEQAFVEAKIYSGNVYGTSAAAIQHAHQANKTALNDIEIQGVAEYKSFDPSVMAVFVLPPDYETWQQRLLARYGGTVDEADYNKRMQTARVELENALTVSYFYYVVNDAVNDAVEVVQKIINHQINAEYQMRGRTIAERLLLEIQANFA